MIKPFNIITEEHIVSNRDTLQFNVYETGIVFRCKHTGEDTFTSYN